MHDLVTPLQARVADIYAQPHTARDAVHRTWKHVAHADGCYGVDRTAGPRFVLDGEDQLCRSAQGISAVGHQHRAGVSTQAFDQNPQACGSRDMTYNSERHLLPLQYGALLNV